MVTQGMTSSELKKKRSMMSFMRRQGYVTYARLLGESILNYYVPKDGSPFAARMDPTSDPLIIDINPIITDNEVLSMLIRHEILHKYLDHENRLLRHLAKAAGMDFDELDDLSLNELTAKLYSNKLFNTAGDYEISNRGYTENDKELQRHIGAYIGVGDILTGLITEDDHPDWVNLPIEDMYDKLIAEFEKYKDKVEDEIEDEMKDDEVSDVIHGTLLDDTTFVDEYGNVFGTGTFDESEWF